MILETSRNKFLQFYNPFKRRKNNSRKIINDTLFSYNESMLEMNGRLIFDTRILSGKHYVQPPTPKVL